MSRIILAIQSSIAIVRNLFSPGIVNTNEDGESQDQTYRRKRANEVADTLVVGEDDSCPKRSRQTTHCFLEGQGGEETTRRQNLTSVAHNCVIMTKVASAMKVMDLIHLRSTCKLWNSVMTPELWTLWKYLEAPDVYRCKISGEFEDVVQKLGLLAKTLRQSNDIPLVTLTVEARRGIGADAERRLFTQTPVLELFSVWSLRLTRLEIKVDGVNTGSYLSMTGLRHVLFNCTPVLAELTIDALRADQHGDQHKWKWEILPNLRDLNLSLDSTENMRQLQSDLIRAATRLRKFRSSLSNFTHALRCIQASPEVCQSVRDLDSPGYEFRRDEWLSQMLHMSRMDSLQLTSFNLKMYGWPPGQQVLGHIKEFLSLQTKTLQVLFLRIAAIWARTGMDSRVHVPRMDALEMLVIGADPRNVRLESCPALKSIWLAFYYKGLAAKLSAWNECLTPLSTSPVNEIKFFDGDEVESFEMINMLTTHFPHITRLTIRLRRKCLFHIWTAWPALETLDVTLYMDKDSMDNSYEYLQYIDHELTGIDVEHCAVLRERLASASAETKYEEVVRMKTAPGITDLRNLRQFVLSHNKKRYWHPKISDVSGYYAFATPETRLQRISMKEGTSEISHTCKTTIKRRLGLSSLVEW